LEEKEITSPSFSPVKQDELPQDENGNFILFVSSQSFAIDPVDIKIHIDGKSAVNQDFYVGEQHNWQEFRFSLPKGNHSIHAESVKGEAELEEEFEIKDKHWAAVDYRYYPENRLVSISKTSQSIFCKRLGLRIIRYAIYPLSLP
jgi:hypothetical protein